MVIIENTPPIEAIRAARDVLKESITSRESSIDTWGESFRSLIQQMIKIDKGHLKELDEWLPEKSTFIGARRKGKKQQYTNPSVPADPNPK